MASRTVRLVDFYCSNYGTKISNEQLYQSIEASALPTLPAASKELYQKLLLENPERTRHVTHDIQYIASVTDRTERLKLYEDSIRALMVDAVSGLFKQTGAGPGDIDFIVVTSSVGKTMPSAASMIASEFGFDSKTVTLNLGDMACSSGLAAMDAGMRFLRSERTPKRCLVVSLEAVTNLFNNSEAGVVPNVVFGEGAAALLLSTHRELAKYQIKHSVRTISAHREAYDVIRFTESKHGPSISLSRDVPKVAGAAIEDNFRQFVPRILSPWDKAKYLINRKMPRWQTKFNYWALHPGGTAVLNGLAQKLKLGRGDLAFSFRVFNRRSNMSSPSVFYVLDEIEQHGPRKQDTVLMMTFGSGFKVNTMLLKRLTAGKPTPGTELEIDCLAGELHCHVQPAEQIRPAAAGLVRAELATLDARQMAKTLWKQTLGVSDVRINEGVVSELTPEQYDALVHELYSLLTPRGRLTIQRASTLAGARSHKKSFDYVSLLKKVKARYQSAPKVLRVN